MSKNKIFKKSIYVLTEGQTEQAYFGRMKEIVNADVDTIFSVTVEIREIVDGSKQDPKGLVKEAKAAKKTYDEVWVVFDRDNRNNAGKDAINKEAIDLAEKWEIKVAFSSICFEHWVLLHFERNNTAFVRSDCNSDGVCTCHGASCLVTYLNQQGHYPDYKKGSALLYDSLQQHNQKAIENAAWLRRNQSPYASMHLVNPYTDVDKFLCEILNVKRVRYVMLNDNFTVDGINFQILSHALNVNNIAVTMNVTNQSANEYILNNYKDILIVDGDNTNHNYTTVTTRILPGAAANNLVLNFTINPAIANLRLKFCSNSLEVFMDL